MNNNVIIKIIPENKSELSESFSSSSDFSKISYSKKNNKNSNNNDLSSQISIEQMNYNKFLIRLVDLFNKNRYKIVYTEIEKNDDFLYKWNISNNLIFTHLQFKCLIEITERNLINMKKKKDIENLEKCLKMIDNLFNKFPKLISLLPKKQIKDQYEILLLYYLNILYFNSIFSKEKKNFTESLSYLSLSQKLIQKLSKEISYPDTIHMIEKIYLSLVSFFIKDKNFHTALNYLSNILLLCYKELDLIMFNIKNTLKRTFRLTKVTSVDVFFHISICFYQMGVCYENLNDFYNSNKAYTQANLISKKFLTNEYKGVINFLENIKNKSDEFQFVFNLINNFDLESFYKEEMKKLHKKKILYELDDEKHKKFEKIINFIEGLNLKDIDYDSADLFDEVFEKQKSRKILKMTKNVKLLNYLTSEKFHSTISKMNNLNVNKFDRETQRQIQNKINAIKNLKISNFVKNHNNIDINNIKNINKQKRPFSSKPNSKLNINNIQIISTSPSHKKYFLTNRPLTSKSKLSRNFSSEKYFLTDNKHSILTLNPSYKKIPFKLNYDKYVFNKNFRKKMNLLDQQSNKEYKFQKNMLQTKSSELIFIPDFNENQIKKDVELFFHQNLDDKLNILKQKNKIVEINQDKYAYLVEKIKDLCDEKTVRTLNLKEKKNFFKYVKQFSIIHKINQKKLINYFKNSKSIDKNLLMNNEINKQFMNKLEFDIDNLDKKEKILKKEIKEQKNQFLRRNNTSDNFYNDKSKTKKKFLFLSC